MKKIDITTLSLTDMYEVQEKLSNEASDIYTEKHNTMAMAKQIEDAIDALNNIEDVFDDANNWSNWYDTVKFLRDALKDADKKVDELDEEYYEYGQAIDSLTDAIDREEEREGA